MSKTVPVEFADRFFWAYDVSLGVLLLEALALDAETVPEQRPAGVDTVLEAFQAQIELGANMSFALDDQSWDQHQQLYAHRLIEQAGRRVRARGVISRADASRRYVLDGEPFFLRHEQHLNGDVIAALADAIGRLVRDELPAPAEPDRQWFFGAEGGPTMM